MQIFKNIMKTAGIVLLLCFIALCFGFNASMKGYQIGLYHFLAGNGTTLPPDYSLNITVTDQIMSVLYIILWAFFSYRSGKNKKSFIFRGMMIYSTIPFIGLLGYFFIVKGMKAGIMLIATLIWAYPFFPLIIVNSMIDSIIVPIAIMLFVIPITAIIAYIMGKRSQY